jgi:putative NIF3 family GTP cyclohydrolase 1 type 2
MTPQPGSSTPPWHPDSTRADFIREHDLTVIRIHYGWDRFGVYTAFADRLGLTSRAVDHGWESVFVLDPPRKIRDLAADIKARLDISGALRVAGDTEKTVAKVANLVGGMGLNLNLYWIRRTIDNGAEAGICGEIDEYMMAFAEDTGFPLIETSHRLSEEYGIEAYAHELRTRYPHLSIVTHLRRRPYITL